MNASTVLSCAALLVSVLTFVGTFVVRPLWLRRRARRTIVTSALETLLSEPVVSARNSVGRGARTRPNLPRVQDVTVDRRAAYEQSRPQLLADQSDMVAGAFTCMWYIEATQLRITGAVKSGSVVSHDVCALYQHIDLMVRELQTMLKRWRDVISADDTIAATNHALDGLPVLVDDASHKDVVPTTVRLATKQASATRSAR